ncbi:MAG TPA: IS30 family transposase [Aliarcobacter sp.]|nr:IS30 family transposase [Aliarcobacter sp.]
MKKRLTIEDRMLIENLLKLNYKLKDISNILVCESSTISREIKKRRITGKGIYKECEKTQRFPYVCNGCPNKTYCRKKKYYYNYSKAQENYNYILKFSRTGIDMSLDELYYWDEYFKNRLKTKNQPVTHIFKDIENTFPKSIPTFYRYIHKGLFPSLNDEMLARAFSYKPIKRTGEELKIRIDNSIRKGKTIDNMKAYLELHPDANIVEMDTVIGKQEDKKCIMTLYFRNSKLMLMFLIDKYKTKAVSDVFKKLRKELGYDLFKKMFEIVLTDNGWEFSKPEDIEFDHNTGEKLINVFYCNPYSSWEKGGIERNHEFIRYIIPKGITFDQLTDKNIIDMMNNINNVKRKSMGFKTPYELFKNIYGEECTKKLHLKHIPSDEVDLSYKLLIK